MVKSCSRCRSAGATERSSPRPSCGPCITPAPRPSSGARQRRSSSRSRRISTPSIRKQVDDAPEEEVATRPLGKASNRRRRSLIVAPMSRCRIDPGRDAPRVVVSPAMPHHASLALRRGRHVGPVRTDLLIAGASGRLQIIVLAIGDQTTTSAWRRNRRGLRLLWPLGT
jgi:hypothetical protein